MATGRASQMDAFGGSEVTFIEGGVLESMFTSLLLSPYFSKAPLSISQSTASTKHPHFLLPLEDRPQTDSGRHLSSGLLCFGFFIFSFSIQYRNSDTNMTSSLAQPFWEQKPLSTTNQSRGSQDNAWLMYLGFAWLKIYTYMIKFQLWSPLFLL